MSEYYQVKTAALVANMAGFHPPNLSSGEGKHKPPSSLNELYPHLPKNCI